MRVIAGTARGRALRAPRGLSTRPMMDIVKGSLFNMLESMGGINGRVLDLFAGSGSLGIEALSRGADSADFVESDRDACRVLRDNLERLGFASRARVLPRSVELFLNAAGEPYDMVFMDAPYPARVSEALLARVAGGGWVEADGVLCIGHHKREPLPDAIGGLVRARHRCFGASCISIYTAAVSNTGDQDV